MKRTSLLLIAAVAALAACDRSASNVIDSAELARDLELATRAPAQPTFEDTAIGVAPEPRPSAPAQQARPTRTRTAERAAPPRATQRRPASPPPVQTVERNPEPEPQPAPQAPPSRFRGFGSGTSFAVSTKSQVCTTNRPGDKIVATLTEAVVGENGAYMPAGTSVVLEVADVIPGDTPEQAAITLRLRSIVVDDQSVSPVASAAIVSDLERREIPRDKGSDRRKVVGGAVAGAVIGQIMGRDTKSTVIGAAAGAAAGTAAAMASRKYDACLPAGGTVRVTTSEQITLGG